MLNYSLDIFFFLRNFAEKFSSSRFEGFLLSVIVFFFVVVVENLKMTLRLIEHFDLLSSVYNSDIYFGNSFSQVL